MEMQYITIMFIKLHEPINLILFYFMVMSVYVDKLMDFHVT